MIQANTARNCRRLFQPQMLLQFAANNLSQSVNQLPMLRITTILVFLLALTSVATAQVTLIFNEVEPVPTAATVFNENDVYRFKNVAPNTDALVTIKKIRNATLLKLDDPSGDAARFQPQIRTTTSNTIGYVRFDFQLVAAGTSTPRIVPFVYLSAQDVDSWGSTGPNAAIREWVEFFNTEPVTLSSNPATFLDQAAAQEGGTFRYIQRNTHNPQNGIGTNDAYEAYTKILGTSSEFTIVGGNQTNSSVNCGGANCDRLNSYAFDPLSSNIPTPNADLSITKTGPATVNQNQTITYTLTAKNNGLTTAHGATVTDIVPASLTNVTISCAVAGGEVVGGARCPTTTGLTTLDRVFIPAFPSGGEVIFTITGTAATPGTLTNSATIVAPNGSTDPTPGNNDSATVTTTVVPVYSITGVVFEDVNYNGGAGRSLAATGATGRGNARVELYNSAGGFVSATATATSGTIGQYQFTGLVAGSYTVRVVGSTVTSSRGGSALIPVQTFTTNGGAADVNRVGGEDPTKIDAAANGTNATADGTNKTLTGLNAAAVGNTPAATAQSIGAVTITNANASGINFGFNFDTIVNVNDNGQGSLRQFILNSNAMSGADTTIFMISDGAADPGLRAGLTNQLTGGVAAITVLTSLPAISGTNTTIDGGTQTVNIGNSNAGTLGAGGKVGVGDTVNVGGYDLSTVARPEVQITDGATNLNVGIDLQAANATVKGIAIYGFGSLPNSNDNANIRIGASAERATIENNIIGSRATAFAVITAPTANSGGDNVRSVGADNGTFKNNLVGFGAGKGLALQLGSASWTIENNEFRGNGIGNPNFDGIDVSDAGSSNNLVSGNLFIDNQGAGVDGYESTGSNTIVNNTITNNGIGSGSRLETPGIRVYGANNTIDRNVIFKNHGAGIMVTPGALNNLITKNSIYDNGTIGSSPSNQIGIDLQSTGGNISVGNSPFVTVNDTGDGDAGANGLLNFPILENARIINSNLVITGFVGENAIIELFIAAPDNSGYGEGKTYLVTRTEGVTTGADKDEDATSGTYTRTFNGANFTDTVKRFQFTIPLPTGVTTGVSLTATATLANATSEFSNTLTVTGAPPVIQLEKTVTPEGVQTPGTELVYDIKFTNSGGAAAVNFRLVDPNPNPPSGQVALSLNANTDFKVGSVVNTLGSTGLTATVTYLNNGVAYMPESGGGGAPAGYDRNVTHIRWTFTGSASNAAGSLSNVAPNNTGSVKFTVRIR